MTLNLSLARAHANFIHFFCIISHVREQIELQLDQLPEGALQEVLQYLEFLTYKLALPAANPDDAYDRMLFDLLKQRSARALEGQTGRVDAGAAKAYFREKYGWEDE
jgi:hypothetical protein